MPRDIIRTSTMVATATSSSASSNPGAALRAGRLSSMRDRMGRTGRGAMLGLSMMQAAPAFQRDEEPSFQNNRVAEMQASRHTAQRYANPGAMTPKLQETSNALREGDTDQEQDADEIDQQASEIADENDAAQTMQLAARARSRTKAATGDATQKMMQQAQKKGEELLAEAKLEITSKGLSGIDWGNKGAILDTIGTAISGIRTALSIFQDGMSEQMKDALTKMGLPMMKMSKGFGAIAAAATVAQYGKWSTIVFVIIPFFFVFIILAYGSIGSIIKGDLTNALTLMRGAL